MGPFLFAILSGVVFEPTHHPTNGATVAIQNLQAATTTADGRFRFDVPRGTYTLRVTQSGFQPQTINATTGEEAAITLRPILAENIVVSGIRAEAETPVTKTDVSR